MGTPAKWKGDGETNSINFFVIAIVELVLHMNKRRRDGGMETSKSNSLAGFNVLMRRKENRKDTRCD